MPRDENQEKGKTGRSKVVACFLDASPSDSHSSTGSTTLCPFLTPEINVLSRIYLLLESTVSIVRKYTARGTYFQNFRYVALFLFTYIIYDDRTFLSISIPMGIKTNFFFDKIIFQVSLSWELAKALIVKLIKMGETQVNLSFNLFYFSVNFEKEKRSV